MSLDYVTYVEAVGPSEQLALFKTRLQSITTSPTSLGQTVKIDTPRHVAVGEVTSGPLHNLSHQPPESYYFVLDHYKDPIFSDLTFRAVLVTGALNVEEHVLQRGELLYLKQTRESVTSQNAPEGSPPDLIQAFKGDLDAWSKVCEQYGVIPRFS